jgi:hypothetical protein
MVSLDMSHLSQDERYHVEPLVADVKSVVARWQAVPIGGEIDLADTDREQYEMEQPYLAPCRAAGFLVEQGVLKNVQARGGPRQDGGMCGFRFHGVHVFQRVRKVEFDDLPWHTLGGPCPVCGVEFLRYGPNGRPRAYCCDAHTAVAKTRRARLRKKGLDNGVGKCHNGNEPT